MKNDNRQVRTPGPKDRNIADHCAKHGIDAEEQKKLEKLLGRHAPLHEIHANSTQKQPKFR
jgi:hypothetical protein